MQQLDHLIIIIIFIWFIFTKKRERSSWFRSCSLVDSFFWFSFYLKKKNIFAPGVDDDTWRCADASGQQVPLDSVCVWGDLPNKESRTFPPSETNIIHSFSHLVIRKSSLVSFKRKQRMVDTFFSLLSGVPAARLLNKKPRSITPRHDPRCVCV